MKIAVAASTLAALVIGFGFAQESASSGTQVYEFDLVTHTQFGMPEQHVFVEDPNNPEMVVRVGAEEAQDPENLAKELYTTTEPVGDSSAMGPFPKGEALGVTLGEWLANTGSGVYRVTGDEAELEASFENLIPNGLYTLWCGRLLIEGGEMVGSEDLPCGVPDGSEATFQADAQGNAQVSLSIVPFPPSTEANVQDFAIAYHSDGQTYGASPGEFGANSHVQLFISDATPLP